MKLNSQKLEAWGYRMVKNFIILKLFPLIHPCDRETDRQTDGR